MLDIELATFGEVKLEVEAPGKAALDAVPGEPVGEDETADGGL